MTGLSLGLGMGLTRRGRGSGAWSPRALFANGEQGVLSDLSDLSTVFQDSAGTTPGGVSLPIGRVLDKSGNGNHASQSTSAARPIFGRVPEGGGRNLAGRTEELNQWGFLGSVSPVVTLAAPLQGFETYKVAGNGGDCLRRLIASDNLSLYAVRVLCRSEGARYGTVEVFERTNRRTASIIDFELGTVDSYDRTASPAGVISSQLLNLGGGDYALRLTVIPSTVAGSSFSIYLASSITAPTRNTLGGPEYTTNTGNGVDGVAYTAVSVELGNTFNPYQRVGSQFDVTEEGKRDIWHANAAATQFLRVNLPDLGSDATIAYVKPAQAPVILTGQSIGAGNFDIGPGADLDVDKLAALVMLDRDLTAPETPSLVSWLEAKGGV